MVTGVITIVKELPQKIWNSIVGAVTKVATWGNKYAYESQRGNERHGNEALLRLCKELPAENLEQHSRGSYQSGYVGQQICLRKPKR